MINASSLICSILHLCPKGLTAKTLCDILIDQEFDAIVAGNEIHRALDKGFIKFGIRMNLEVVIE